MKLLKNMYYQNDENAIIIIRCLSELERAIKEKHYIIKSSFELLHALDKFGVQFVDRFDCMNDFTEYTSVNMKYYNHPINDKVYMISLFSSKYLVSESNLEQFSNEVINRHNIGYRTEFKFDESSIEYSCEHCKNNVKRDLIEFAEEIRNNN